MSLEDRICVEESRVRACLLGGGFDFTTETQSPLYDEYRDITWCIVVDPPLGDLFCLWNGAGLLAVPDSLVLEYYAQKDGTNNLRDDIIVPVRTTTWGGVKALYR